MVRRDEETNELIKTFVDKVKRKKLTKLKKAVLEKREQVNQLKLQRKQEREATRKHKPKDEEDAMYETVDENEPK